MTQTVPRAFAFSRRDRCDCGRLALDSGACNAFRFAGTGRRRCGASRAEREHYRLAAHAAGAIGKDPAAGVFVFAQTADGTYGRMFAPMAGIAEDPATGCAHGPLFVYLLEHGALQEQSREYVCEQGVKLGRRSVLHVRVNMEGGVLESVDVVGRAIHIGGGAFAFTSEFCLR